MYPHKQSRQLEEIYDDWKVIVCHHGLGAEGWSVKAECVQRMEEKVQGNLNAFCDYLIRTYSVGLRWQSFGLKFWPL